MQIKTESAATGLVDRKKCDIEMFEKQPDRKKRPNTTMRWKVLAKSKKCAQADSTPHPPLPSFQQKLPFYIEDHHQYLSVVSVALGVDTLKGWSWQCRWSKAHKHTCFARSALSAGNHRMVFIGPRADHSLPMSLTHSLTDKLTTLLKT